MTIGHLIKQLELMPEDKIFIRRYRRDGEKELCVQDLSEDDKLMKSKVKYLQHHYGGKQNDYNCYRFILE